MKPWHEQDAFWSTLFPVLFPERRWEAVPAEVDRILALLNVAPGARVLDLCCGPGRHSLELARRGFHVTGVDRTAEYLNRARQQARAEGLDVEFVQADMRDFCRPEAFDAALNMFTSFGYFEDPAQDRQVATNLYQSLKPGGTLLIEMAGKEVLARVFRERDWHEEYGVIILEERKLSQNWGWIDNRWIMLRGDEHFEFRLGHRLYSAVELSQLLAQSGFTSVEVYGDLEGAPYDHTARRLVAVAHKGGL